MIDLGNAGEDFKHELGAEADVWKPQEILGEVGLRVLGFRV